MKVNVTKIKAECENGHTQEITITGMTRVWAEIHCGLLDGSSSLYIHPPGTESMIGKCGICGKKFKASITSSEEVEE